ncbi:hypothetical protein I7I50_00369 [Histoplasma capsulatum G186AR]|uniref:Uncharacterized protein n=1 Tax=Ajellomyces capsulatus TaxID=5037 RepID=A0A8H7YJF8_AJECA|nr:hypothetical protein I7I52_07637 [Histoplasma capsulatum]QSS72506.1 hypothetical protein I7I50_00369 [Histoplasma capsulatum G186AR]
MMVMMMMIDEDERLWRVYNVCMHMYSYGCWYIDSEDEGCDSMGNSNFLTCLILSTSSRNGPRLLV